MKHAIFQGCVLDIAQFIGRAGPEWKAKGLRPSCPNCGIEVDPYGVHSPESVHRFDHPDLAVADESFDDCPLARRGGRFGYLEVDALDTRQARQLRLGFPNATEEVGMAYAFVSRATGYRCTLAEFVDLVRRADRKGVWGYVGLHSWAVPFILLSLGNFTTRTGIPFHFVFHKDRSIRASPWHDAKGAKLRKHFTGSGKLFTRSENADIEVTEAALRRVAGDLTHYRFMLPGWPRRSWRPDRDAVDEGVADRIGFENAQFHRKQILVPVPVRPALRQ